ncbi:uncharacterized protein ACMZJ9_018414 isoform 1-T1 [Mantella aurantiaca]
MVMNALFCISFLLLSTNRFYVKACDKISIDQNPRELKVQGTKEVKFTCTVSSNCDFTSFVQKNSIFLARIPDIGDNNQNININGISSEFTVTVKNTNETHQGVYYCGAQLTKEKIDILGCGTHIYSGGSDSGTRTGILFAILCACVGMMHILL